MKLKSLYCSNEGRIGRGVFLGNILIFLFIGFILISMVIGTANASFSSLGFNGLAPDISYYLNVSLQTALHINTLLYAIVNCIIVILILTFVRHLVIKRSHDYNQTGKQTVKWLYVVHIVCVIILTYITTNFFRVEMSLWAQSKNLFTSNPNGIYPTLDMLRYILALLPLLIYIPLITKKGDLGANQYGAQS